MRMLLPVRLAAAFLRARIARCVLSVLAIMAATCVVVWVVGTYEALLKSYDVFAQRALGRYILSVDPISRALDREVPPSVVTELRSDPAVTAADPMWAERISVRPVAQSRRPDRDAPPPEDPSGLSEGDTGPRPPNEVMLLATDAPAAPFDMQSGSWLDAQTSNGETIPACLSDEVARRLGLDLGDTFLIGRADDAPTATVVGIVDNPLATITGSRVGSVKLPSPSIAGAYVSMKDAERIHKRPRRITFVGVTLAPGVDVHKFRYDWGPRLASGANPQQFQEDFDLEETLDEAEAARNMSLQAYAATGVSMLLAFLMVFNTLNMGVTERIRQFALLRAVALTRSQVAVVIVIEGLVLAALGFAGGLGLAALALRLISLVGGEMLRHNPTIGWLSVTLAAVSSFGGALLASIIPAARATRVRPLDVVAPGMNAGQAARRAASPWLIVIGAALVAADPLISFALMPSLKGPVIPCMALGFVSLATGVLLLAPALVVLVDRFISPVLARVLGISPRLLGQQLSSHLWRSAGAAIALTIGLGLFLAIQTWGFTMLSAFVPGPWAPDAIIAFGSEGATADQVAAIARLDGIDSSCCLPAVVEQPRLKEDLTGSARRASIIRQDNVTMIGLDPQRALGGASPLLDFEWVAGTPETAIARMAQGHACVVPDHFLKETGLSVGDTFTVVPPENALEPRTYTIVGAVRLPGWHWVSKLAGLRMRTHRTAALVFTDYESVAADFDLRNASHVWLRCTRSRVDPQILQRKVNDIVTAGKPAASTEDEGPAVRVSTVERTRQMVLKASQRWIWAASVLPLVVVLIACLGLLNLILASVRARYWELGVLRAIGFTRWTIVRLILAEGLLVGTVACLLSLVFGLVAGWCGVGAASRMSFFGGLDPDLVIPVAGTVVGGLLLLVFTALAASWPAVNAGRRRPLDLLQDGASAF
ncbi:MAG: ABC transporter permease [Planctomycetes bacterium]|nr:ABC transporter permease [Planctomycetota bacterium]